jgi:prolyl-tRNA synthetase
MPTIQSADLWRESGRYEAYGKEMLRIVDRHEREMLYGPTNEEMITDIFRSYVRSYKQLPLNLYHIQWKFRDEVRPRFGVMRGREFLMKDAYSFDLTADAARQAYYRMFCAYLNTFSRMGLKAVPMRADTGPIGGDLSHEFIILADTGESAVFCDSALVDMPAPGSALDFAQDLLPEVETRTRFYAATEEKHDQAAFEAQVPAERRLSARGIEVGHIFYFGTKYSKAMGAEVTGPDGRNAPVEMGSYGIGVSRLVGAIIEASHDDKGVIWPASVAPFETAVLSLRNDDADVTRVCESAYEQLRNAGLDVLYDDTAERPGAKFSTMELIGVPTQVVVGPKGVKAGLVEFRERRSGASEEMSLEAAVSRVIASRGS